MKSVAALSRSLSSIARRRGKTLPEVATGDPDWYYSHFRRKLFLPPLDEQADLIAYQFRQYQTAAPRSRELEI